MSYSFNEICPEQPVCISVKNVEEKYSGEFIQAYLTDMFCCDKVAISDIHIDEARNIHVCFDRWFMDWGVTYNSKMEVMSDVFAHGNKFLVSAPNTNDTDFAQDWILEYVDSVSKYSEIQEEYERNRYCYYAEELDEMEDRGSRLM